ncbi:MAG: hypothetical protein SFY32_09340 [Bacteroidota bacterium]|nr:hypothetical protein [Bacteroidota bacterium]
MSYLSLFANWNFVRFVKLALGIIVGVQSFHMHEPLYSIIAAYLYSTQGAVAMEAVMCLQANQR